MASLKVWVLIQRPGARVENGGANLTMCMCLVFCNQPPPRPNMRVVVLMPVLILEQYATRLHGHGFTEKTVHQHLANRHAFSTLPNQFEVHHDYCAKDLVLLRQANWLVPQDQWRPNGNEGGLGWPLYLFEV